MVKGRQEGRSEEKVARSRGSEVGSVKSLQESLPALHSGGWQTNIPATQEREGDVKAQSSLCEGDQGFKAAGSLLVLRLFSR